MNDSNIYADLVKVNGEVEFQGAAYALIQQPALTNCVFPGWWGDVKAGEDYICDWSAPAMGQDGEEYVVRWQFTLIKGEEPDDDAHDWDDVHEIVPA